MFIQFIAENLGPHASTFSCRSRRSEGASISSFRRIAARLACLGALSMAGITVYGAGEAAVLGPSVLKRMSVEELLEQEIVALSRHPEQWGDSASSLFMLTGRSPEVVAASSLPELLRLAPNLFVAQSTSSNWGISARGFMRTNATSNKLLVTIDGRSVYSPFFSNVFWDSQQVFLPDLEQIEVISGPSGANWGSNAVNGVVSIRTRSAHDTQGGILFARSGTHEEMDGGVRYGGKIGKTGAYRVYAQRMDVDSTLSSEGNDDDFDSWHFTQAGFRTDWESTGDSEITLQGDAFSGHYRNGDVLPPIKAEGGNVLARWSRELGNGASVWVRLYHDYYRRNTSDLLTLKTHTTDLEFQHRFQLNRRQEFQWGGNYRRIDDEMTDTIGFVIIPERLQYDLASVFGQHKIQFADTKLRLTTGLRIEENHFSDGEVLPNVRLAWRPVSGQTFWLSASRAARIPDRLDTGFHAPADPPHAVTGGPDFSSEVLYAYEIGWRTRPTKNLSITTTLFFHDYDHLRSVEPTTPIVIANKVGGRSYGAEFFLDWDVTDWWRLRLGGFHITQDTWREPGGNDAEGGLGEISFPDFQVLLRSSFRLSESTRLWLGLRHIDEVPGFDEGQTGTVPAYTELDATLTWRVNEHFEVALSGRNLLDRSHPEIGLEPTRREIERSGRVTLRWGF